MHGTIQFDGSTSDPFKICCGVKQGCVLAPTLFGTLFSLLLRQAFGTATEGVYLHSRTDGNLFTLARLKAKTKVRPLVIRDMLFADDAAVVAHSQEHLQTLMDNFSHACQDFSLVISLNKTKTMGQGTENPPSITINNYTLEAINTFTYLGSTITDNLSLDVELSRRIGKAASTFRKLTKRRNLDPIFPPIMEAKQFLPSVPYAGEDFMSFFTDKVLAIREKANQAIPTTGPSPDVLTVGTYRFSNEPLNSFSPIYFSEASSLIHKSKTTTCLLDPIPTHLLKGVLPFIGSSILDQINGSLVTGYVPRSYRVAVIKPLLKKTSLDPDVLANYRPISNLPFISKVLEKVVVTQLLEHLQRNSLFEMFRSGFRAHHSTETAFLKVTNDLLIASDHGLVSMLVLLDLSAAFDTVDHSILLHRLEHVIGIKGTSLDCRVSHGVPQGSVLGPILFTLYMLPLGNIIQQHGINFHCYADDTQLYLSMKPEETEKDRLDHMITLDGISLTSSLSVRNLGVTFDQNLSFNSHIKLVSRSPIFHLRNITKIRKLLTRHDAEKSLQLIQNAAARVLTGIDKRDHITLVMASLHWLPVKFRIIFKTLLLANKVLRGLAPSYLEELVIPYQPNRPLRSQNTGLLVVSRVSRSRMGGRAFSYQAPLLWNQLPVQFQLLS
ncbi:putative RNA-directed DNA polymerase from transposon X-element [Takifugu flavidus]|uniref:Putative RNA-directed DNA polymerase from transposon X-element n=1 Tax=Takifugu flavidus TaxID=433684 RepID=A0A5C6P065_9TELE|nr:putative RNA-directed DNA polymerase from transposon X-element [Takifugu flavidus]